MLTLGTVAKSNLIDGHSHKLGSVLVRWEKPVKVMPSGGRKLLSQSILKMEPLVFSSSAELDK